MIAITIAGLALIVAVVALITAISAETLAEQALTEHGYTLDAADDLFEDHEERITELELQHAPMAAGDVVGVAGGTITGGGLAQFQQETGNG